MAVISTEKVKVVKSSLIECKHAFSTRIGGVSNGVYGSLNLGKNRGDAWQNVKRNWELFGETTEIPTEKIVCASQIHSAIVKTVTEKDLHSPYKGNWVQCDGFVTKQKNVPLAVFTADCAPLLMYDPKAKVIAAIHCGWKSTVADIEYQAIKQMLDSGATFKNIKASIGPCIQKCCFETGKEVPEMIDRLLNGDSKGTYTLKNHSTEKYLVDLPGVIEKRLLQLGLEENNIEKINLCTMCHPEMFWSHRYTKGLRGSQANIIML